LKLAIFGVQVAARLIDLARRLSLVTRRSQLPNPAVAAEGRNEETYSRYAEGIQAK
jgi:hypothetical protein